MPADIGGPLVVGGEQEEIEGWYRYWGTTGPVYVDFFPGEPAEGIKSETRIRGEWEIVESETGALRRQVRDNDVTYSMPEFQIYDVRDRASWHSWVRRTYAFPLVERLRPEALQAGEDNCYKRGMLISPDHFRQFCVPAYREAGTIARDCMIAMLAIDTDGNAMQLVPLVEFILMGWLEKETVNEGGEHRIRNEIISKVPALLKEGRYFPNGDHGIQPTATFPNLCRFMTLLHEVTGNPEGEFPRMPT